MKRFLVLFVRVYKELFIFFYFVDVGIVLKVILVFKGGWFNVEGLFLEELYVFEVRFSFRFLRYFYFIEF